VHGVSDWGVARRRAAAAIPAQAQGPDDFLDHLNSIGIGNRDDKHNFDRVGLGNVICWRLYGGEAPGQITDMVITNSRFGGGRELTRQQAEAAALPYPTYARMRHRTRRPSAPTAVVARLKAAYDSKWLRDFRALPTTVSKQD
jgi:hypothetical protein